MSEVHNFVDQPGVIVENLKVDAAGYYSAIVLNRCNHAVVRHVEVFGFDHVGIFLLDSNGVRVEDCRIHDGKEGSNAVYCQGRENSITYCEIWQLPTGIWLNNGYPEDDADQNTVRLNTIHHCRDVAVAMSGSCNLIELNYFLDNGTAVAVGYAGGKNAYNRILNNFGRRNNMGVTDSLFCPAVDTLEAGNQWR